MKTLALILMLALTAPAFATNSPGNSTVERKQTTTVERDNDSGDWGLLGLLGLAGLAGLLRRKREDDVTRYDATRRSGP